MKFAAIITICILFYCSCGSKRNTDKSHLLPVANQTGRPLELHEYLFKKYQNQVYEIRDGFRLQLLLEKALKQAILQPLPDSYVDTIPNVYPDDESLVYGITTIVKSGHLFSKKHRHIMIKRISPHEHYIDIYIQKGSQSKLVVSTSVAPITYVNDTIYDVNSDGYKDFLINLYGSCGSYLKNFHVLYLFNTKGESTNEYNLKNTSFKPLDKKLFEIDYGPAGMVGMHKYKWRDCAIDTVEAIYPNLEDTLHKSYIRKRNHKEERIYMVPKEYQETDYYWWFEGKDYNDV